MNRCACWNCLHLSFLYIYHMKDRLLSFLPSQQREFSWSLITIFFLVEMQFILLCWSKCSLVSFAYFSTAAKKIIWNGCWNFNSTFLNWGCCWNWSFFQFLDFIFNAFKIFLKFVIFLMKNIDLILVFFSQIVGFIGVLFCCWKTIKKIRWNFRLCWCCSLWFWNWLFFEFQHLMYLISFLSLSWSCWKALF